MATPSTHDSDASLLRQFAQERSETALRLLTERHLDLVFGTALRRTGDRGAAEEITQNVFIALARKAAWLQREASLAAWLHQAAVLESRQWWRGETRRRQREQTAINLQTTMKTADENAPAMAAVLDEALLQLRQGDRQALLLRFFEGRNHREIGAALGIGEDAARKRVDKAIGQVTEFFRARGFVVGSAAVMLLLTDVASSAPSGLASAVVRATIASGSAPAAPWLVKLLGLGKGQLAAICTATLLVPIAWQQARLSSAHAEQQRLEGLLTLLQSQRANLNDELTQVQRQLTRVASNPSQTNGVSASDSFDSPIYLWNEDIDYVRVPKEVMRRIGFVSSLDHQRIKVMDAAQKRLSPIVLDALGLTKQEQAAAQENFAQDFNGYRAWNEANSYLTDYSKIDVTAMSPPPGLHVNNDTRVWVTPSLSEAGGSWRAQSFEKLAAAIGQERAELLLAMANDDGSLEECLRQYGANGSYTIVTPNPEGGFWMSQNATQRSWSFNAPVSFSEALNSRPTEPFDEAAARAELTKRFEQVRGKIPDNEIPSMDEALGQWRKQWELQQRIIHGDKVLAILGHPLPVPVLDYLRQWRAAHPDVPDAVPDTSFPHHP